MTGPTLTATERAAVEEWLASRPPDATIVALRDALDIEVSLHPYPADVPDKVRRVLADTAAAAEETRQRVVEEWLRSEEAERRLAEALLPYLELSGESREAIARAILAALRDER